MSRTAPLVLIIFDGWGVAPPGADNAILGAEPRHYLDLLERYPSGVLHSSGHCVGLPEGLMGNSEVGHMNLGAGRIVDQEIVRIDKSIADGSFAENAALAGLSEHVRRTGGAVHLMGLVSDGGVHSSDAHVRALLAALARADVPGDRVFIHAFLDGRDTPPRSARGYVGQLEADCREAGVGRVATISGRYWAMDRDKRWDRVEKAWRAIVDGEAPVAASADEAIAESYAADRSDEFVLPTIVVDGELRDGGRDRAIEHSRVRDGDAVFFFNFRADRARQLTLAFIADDFDGFARPRRPAVHFATMTSYRKDFDVPVAFAPQHLEHTLGSVLAERGLRQLRIAETEKYAHVTFFFSGGREDEFAGESRILVPSPRCATYDLEPAMSAREVTDRLLDDIAHERHDVVILNFANADMVGHTGEYEATVAAIRVLDACLGRIVKEVVERRGGVVMITADHGNAEQMRDPVTGEPHTAHTTTDVPFVLVADALRNASIVEGGQLANVSPTMLACLGLDVPASMTAGSLIATP